MRDPRRIAALVAAAALVVGVAVVWQVTGESESTSQPREILTDTVGRQTLRDQLTINGELRRDELQTINSPFDGRVSQVSIDDGDEIEPGDVLLALDGRPAVAANGDFAFYRSLDVGSDGPDVLQLEQILSDSGFSPGTVDRLFTEDTRRALRRWQTVYGYGGATPEPVETVIITLDNGNGYSVGDKDTRAIKIGPSVPADLPVRWVPEQDTSASTVRLLSQPMVESAAIPAIGVEVPEATVTEGETLAITLTASPAPSVDTQVQLTFGGDATGGDQDDVDNPDIDVDYLNDPLEDSPILWPANATTYTVNLATVADDVDEDDEEWTLAVAPEQVIGEGINYNPAPINTVTVTIVDATDDQVPTFSVSVEPDEEETDEGDGVSFTITADAELGREVEVRYSLSGTAGQGDDYDDQGSQPRFTFPAGEDEFILTIPTVQDDVIEPSETLTLTLLAADDPADYRLGATVSGTVVIEDEDDPELTILGTEATVPEGGSIAVTIVADEPPSRDISVDYRVSGTATMGLDFAVLTGSVTFPAGAQQVEVIVQTLDDDVVFIPSDLIIADWPARVGTVFVDEGETVQLGQQLLTLTEPDFTVNLFANPTDRSELALGQSVQVELEAGNQKVDGVIIELDDAASLTDSGAERYEGVVQVGDELFAVDGASVTIEVTLDERIDAMVVPRAAVFQDGTGQPAVRVIDPETLQQREVRIEVGIQEGSYTEVVSGLAGNEIVVIDVTGG